VFFAERLIFMPPDPGYDDDARVLKLQSASGETIAAMYLPAKPGYPTFLYTHGNAEDLGTVKYQLQDWNAQGFGVLGYDFPGYGHSTGRVSEANCSTAISAAWDYLTVSQKVSPSSIIAIGRSVGGGPTVWLAEQKQPAGLVLLSPFTSAFAVRIPVPIFPCDRFPNLKRIPHVKCPLLVIHGEADTLISPSHGRKLVEAAMVSDKTFLGIPGAGHNDLLDVGGNRIDDTIRDFAMRVAPAP